MRRRPANERASERVRIGAPATLKWGEQELTGFVEVVNLAGMYVATQRAPQPQIGDYVELVFSLPGDNRSFRVRGNVVFLDGTPSSRTQAPRLRRPLRAAAGHPARRHPEPAPGALGELRISRFRISPSRPWPAPGSSCRRGSSTVASTSVCATLALRGDGRRRRPGELPTHENGPVGRPDDEGQVLGHRALPCLVALLSQSCSRLSPFWVTLIDEEPLVRRVGRVQVPGVGPRHRAVVEVDLVADDSRGQDPVDVRTGSSVRGCPPSGPAAPVRRTTGRGRAGLEIGSWCSSQERHRPESLAFPARRRPGA